MNDQEFEQYINRIAAGLPRRSVAPADKQAVWSRLRDYLRQTRRETEFLHVANPGFWAAWRFSRAVATTLAVVLSLGAVGGVARAAKGSLPGDSLYPVKKAVEQVEVAIASVQGQEKKVQTLKSHAQTRLGEVATLVSENKVEEAVVQKSLQDLETATKQVVAASEDKPELTTHAVELAKQEREVLTAVATQVEGEVKDRVQKVLTASQESLDKLQTAVGGEDEVKGAGTSTATSTSSEAGNKVIKPKDIRVESQIQIDDIIQKPGSEHEQSVSAPEILEEP